MGIQSKLTNYSSRKARIMSLKRENEDLKAKLRHTQKELEKAKWIDYYDSDLSKFDLSGLSQRKKQIFFEIHKKERILLDPTNNDDNGHLKSRIKELTDLFNEGN